MLMVIMGVHLMVQLTLEGLRLNVPEEFNKFVGNKNTITNIYKIQG